MTLAHINAILILIGFIGGFTSGYMAYRHTKKSAEAFFVTVAITSVIWTIVSNGIMVYARSKGFH